MKVIQETWTSGSGWKTIYAKGSIMAAKLVLCFGNRQLLENQTIYHEISAKYPLAEIVVCTTSGEISDVDVLDDSVSLTAMEFEHTTLKTCSFNINTFDNSQEAGMAIVDQLRREDLNHVFVISDGQIVNGSDLVKGLNTFKLSKVAVTGGLAGDGYDFNKTLVGLNQFPKEGEIIAIGFYGDRLKVGFGSKGGWNTFGPERKITKSIGNVLYELDGQSALELYKQYLGDAAKDLPSSALFYPLSIKIEGAKEAIVRTILSIDEEAQNMTFAGDVPEGAIAQLMIHNADNLINGAEQAAQQSILKLTEIHQPDVAILVSCVGRKIVLGQNIEEEVEVIRDLIGNQTAITGFYSYGEIAPQQYFSRTELHNQTMTITTLTEE